MATTLPHDSPEAPRPDPAVAARPAAERPLTHGTVELTLFAPTVTGVTVVGDFTAWKGRPLRQSGDGTWRIRVALADGDHQYQFCVRSKSWFRRPDEWVTITDPKATRVDKASGNGVLRVRNGRCVVDEYKWLHDDVFLPPNNQLVIYELHVGDFSGGEDDRFERGKFKHVTAKLDYLKDLGVNCLELMPVLESPGDYAWGYTPQFLFAPESSYGPSEDLKRLIDEAHGRGMRVVFDGVYNHGHTSHPLTQIDHDYWFHHEPKDRAQSWGPQYNYELHDEAHDVMPARKFVSENITFWVQEYHLDGIRYDAAKQIENWEALKMMSDTARHAAGAKPFINVAEYSPENPELVGPPDSGRPMDACWRDTFFWRIADDAIAHSRVDLDAIKRCIDPKLEGFTDCTQVVNYVSNHDHRRLMPRLAQESQAFDEGAFARAKLAATILFTSVGIPLIWMGEEFGEYKPKTNGPSKIDWTILKNEANQKLLAHYKSLIFLRKTRESLQANNCDFFHEDPEAHVLAYVRWNDQGQRVAVVANFSQEARPGYHIGAFPAAGEGRAWHDWLYDVDTIIPPDGLRTDLAPFEAKVYVI